MAEDPDIIGLQELDEAIGAFFVSKLKEAGYNHIFRKRPTKFKADGCAIAWKAKRFSLKAKPKHTELNIAAKKNPFISKSNLKEYLRNNIIMNILLKDVSF